MVYVLIKQIVIMAFLMALGLGLIKKGILSQEGCKDLGAMLLNVVIPCVILNSYMIEFSADKLRELGVSALLSLLSLILAMAVSWAFFGKRKGIQNFAASFGNAGFIGIPLTQALFGSQAVFYLAAYVALLNLFQWTYGLYLITGEKEVIHLKAVLKNPVFLGLCAGLVFFLLPVKIPGIITKTIGYMADMNTPLAMIVLGSYLVKTDIKSIFFSKNIYMCVLLRLTVIPLLTLALFKILPVQNTAIIISVLIAASTSVGGNIAIFAQQYKGDYILAIKAVCLSTILSLVTIPIFFALVQKVFFILPSW
ncbi:MAG: AEC family transporter [Lachnoclostridium edouardi]|uniref:AEC family transporter n=1 Tax=Lachnoclostridium edouardi TaxID=1926283 RepID=UPI0026DD36AD|nr:AEC family transporter [Lachnoclostridium edouardi]MDO4277856.1 AEC family transporter [Lachnoclostridium edouardi]